MKKSIFKLILLVVSVSCVLSSCSKAPDKILPKKNGKWDAVITYRITSTNGYDTSSVFATSFTFLEDGTGSYIDVSATGVTFTWAYSAGTKKITYQRTAYDVIVFDVEVMERKHELWHNVSTEIVGLETYTTDLTVDFTKSD